LPERCPAGAVLVTRPEPAATDTANRLIAMGRRPVLAPMLRIAPRAMSLPPADRLQAVLATSANALASLPHALHGLKLLAVGDATAARARAAGFGDVENAGRDAQALAALVASLCDPRGKTLLLACGAGQGLELAGDLRARKFKVVRRVAYEARELSVLPDAALDSLRAGEVAAALFFSPATARAFVGLCRRTLAAGMVAKLEALVISRATAAQLAPLPWRGIRVASHPNQESLLALLT
jgi:uroporphyrinogen-III synthase